MPLTSFWKALRLLALSGALVLAAVAPPSVDPLSSTPVAFAGDEDDDDDDDDDEDAEAQGRVLNGQVLGIYRPNQGWAKAPGVTFDETTPPNMVALRVARVGNEIVPAIMYNPNEINEWGLNLGDHVSLDGEFQGGTFYANNMEVDDRCC